MKMTAKQRFTKFAAISFGVLACSFASMPSATAQATEGRQFGSVTGQIVNDALTEINRDNYGGALAKLSEALSQPELNPYEKSIIHQMQGQCYYELDQVSQSATAFENAINAGGLLPNEVEGIEKNIAQLLIAAGRYREGATRLENFINKGNTATPEFIDMLVGAWVEVPDYRRALPWAERWFNNANPKERKHFDLMNFLYNNLGMSGRQADIVLQMINRYPEDKSLWETWASMLANGGREQDAFEVNKMMYLGGAINDQPGIMKIIQYYSYYDMPFQAAKILEREINAGTVSRSTDNLILLSDLLRQAREYDKAIPILENAAKSAGTGRVYAQLGEALYNSKRCDDAETAFRKAVELGYQRGKAWMLVATCRYEESQQQERIDCEWSDQRKAESLRTVYRNRAREAFRNVPARSPEGRDATQWIRFIGAEEDAIQARCDFEASVEKEECFQDIELSYNNIVFTEGVLKLSDPEKCSQYVQEYDTKFRIVTKEEG